MKKTYQDSKVSNELLSDIEFHLKTSFEIIYKFNHELINYIHNSEKSNSNDYFDIQYLAGLKDLYIISHEFEIQLFKFKKLYIKLQHI